MSLEGERIADDAIYLQEDRYNKPKLVFQMIGDRIEAEKRPPESVILDMGCATGEQLYYMMERFPQFRLAGVDVSEKMIAQAQERIPKGTFFVGSALDPALFQEPRYDVITCTGVLSIFDDPQPVLENMLASLRPGGSILISAPINTNAIDTIIRYRRTSDEPGPWESGWNIWSKETIERLLNNTGYRLEWDWTPWDPPFEIAQGDDPMRGWTIRTEEKPRQRLVGAGLWLNPHLLHIRVLERP